MAHFTYLSISNFRSKPKRIHFQVLVDEAKTRLLGWKGELVSMEKQVQLVQSVYHNVFLHSFSIYQWPTRLLKHISACARNFIWLGYLTL